MKYPGFTTGDLDSSFLSKRARLGRVEKVTLNLL